MRIVIRKNRDGTANIVLITFNTNSEQFESAYERNKFFRELHGWEQTVPAGQKKYRYHRPGVLDEVPHAKIADSVFMIMQEHMKRMQDFFSQWQKKVDWEMHQVMMERRSFMDMVENDMNEENENRNLRDTDRENEKKKLRKIKVE